MLDSTNIRLAPSPLTRNRYGRIREQFGSISDIESRLTAKVGEAGARISRDIWSGFFAPSTEVDASTSGSAMRRLADWASDAISSTPDGADLLSRTTGSTFASCEAAEIMASLIESLDLPKPDERVERSEMSRPDGTKMSLDRDGASVTMKQQRDGKASEHRKDFDSEAGAEQFLQDAIAQASARGFGPVSSKRVDPEFEAAVGSLLDEIEADPIKAASLANRAARIAKQVSEDLDETESVLSMAYGTERGSEMFEEPTDEDRAEMASLMSAKGLRDFMREVGRFLDMMRSSDVPERVKGGLVIDGIESTDDFAALLPDEVAMFAVPALRGWQTSRIVSGEASGFRRTEQGSREAGAFHVALDRSDSMDRFGVSPRAFAMASVLMAVEAEREVSLSIFDTACVDIALDFSTPAARLASIRSVLGIGNSGGTDFRPVIERASRLAPATDLLLISDGSGPIDDARATEVFAERQLAYIVIGSDFCVNPALRRLSGDRFILAQSLTQDAIDLAASSTR